MLFDDQFIHWLLESEIPSIRYFTRRDLLDQPESNAEVQAARHDIMHSSPVSDIFAHQTSDGHWEAESSYYTPKYTSTHWSMMLLTEL
ncbi:MAG TPA: hypothetical protein VJZ27_01530, partial [Aggregatilineales bacterium]|nr:hypothetical protein [Aggregatilineales bacterium]